MFTYNVISYIYKYYLYYVFITGNSLYEKYRIIISLILQIQKYHSILYLFRKIPIISYPCILCFHNILLRKKKLYCCEIIGRTIIPTITTITRTGTTTTATKCSFFVTKYGILNPFTCHSNRESSTADIP